MATTEAGARLTERHRQQQLAVRARALRLLLALWPLFDPRNIDESWRTMEPAVLAIIGQGRVQSASVATGYFRAFRVVEGIAGDVLVPPAPRLNRTQVLTSLRVTGPVTAKRLTLLNRPDVAPATFNVLAGALGRYVLDAGRDTVMGAVRQDRRALGWARVTSGEPCAFCAMLSGRGAVYSRETVDFRAHDACACTSEPVYSRDAARPGRGEEFAALYNEATRDAESGDLLNAFRRAYEGRAS